MRVNVGDILLCPKFGQNYVVVEIEDWHVTLLKSEKLYSEHKGLGDLWRVSKTYLGDNFIQL